MFILNWYVTKNFLATFSMAIVVLTFAMTGANLMKVIEYISQGIPPLIAGKFLLLALPMALAFSIPWAALVSIMLVFGRMSADNEITAMRACGISILQIISPIIVSSFLLSCLCLWLQLQVGPPALGDARDLVKSAAANSPLAFFTPGIPVQLGDLTFFIDSKDSEGNEDHIYGVQIYLPDKDGTTKQDILASRGTLSVDSASQVLTVTLYDALVETVEGSGKDRRKEHSFSESVELRVPFGGRRRHGHQRRDQPAHRPGPGAHRLHDARHAAGHSHQPPRNVHRSVSQRCPRRALLRRRARIRRAPLQSPVLPSIRCLDSAFAVPAFRRDLSHKNREEMIL